MNTPYPCIVNSETQAPQPLPNSLSFENSHINLPNIQLHNITQERKINYTLSRTVGDFGRCQSNHLAALDEAEELAV